MWRIWVRGKAAGQAPALTSHPLVKDGHNGGDVILEELGVWRLDVFSIRRCADNCVVVVEGFRHLAVLVILCKAPCGVVTLHRV
jgi:hypothetical protein